MAKVYKMTNNVPDLSLIRFMGMGMGMAMVFITSHMAMLQMDEHQSLYNFINVDC